MSGLALSASGVTRLALGSPPLLIQQMVVRMLVRLLVLPLLVHPRGGPQAHHECPLSVQWALESTKKTAKRLAHNI